MKHHIRTATLIAALALVLAFAAACDGDDGDSAPPSPTATISAGGGQSMTLHGSLTLDGQPLDAQFLGARVVRDGLVGACQVEIPQVVGGRYEIEVASDAQVRGCGAPGANVLLWTFIDDRYLFATTTAPWQQGETAAPFDAAFASADPEGAGVPVTEIKGHLFAADGSQLPAGTVVEAYAGDVRCGVTSLRSPEETEGYFTLVIAGPDSVAGCREGASLTFRLDGTPAAQTATNDLRGGDDGHELDLTQQ